MLSSLLIKNLALVKEITINFNSGLSIITGETGAGKSTIIGALNLILGKKISNNIIGNFDDNTIVEALFKIDSDSLKILLSQAEIDFQQNELIIRRIVSENGKSRAFINDIPVNNSFLKIIGEELIDLHGQHDHQSLLNISKHIDFLDNYLKIQKSIQEYQKKFNEYNTLLSKKQNMLDEYNNMQTQIDFYKFQQEELKKYDIENFSIEKLEKLTEERELLKNSLKNQEIISEIDYYLSQKDESIIDILNQLSIKLNAEIKKKFESAIEILKNIVYDLGILKSNSNHNPERLDQIEESLFGIEQLKRKYNKNITDLLSYYHEIKNKIDEFESKDYNLNKLDNEIEKIYLEAQKLADILSLKRKKGSEELCCKIIKELQELGMKYAQFLVNFEKTELGSKGQEKAVFFLSTNKGTMPQNLAQIASGGEISRVMLALKTVFASTDTRNTLIFDEIDVNLGGESANIVGDKLKQLALDKQVICISHLPQIACKGEHHYKVVKTSNDINTITNIFILNRDERVKELARMLGGDVMLNNIANISKILT